MSRRIMGCLLFCCPWFVHAGWPVLAVPDRAFLLAHQYIDTGTCPDHQGRFISPLIIPVQLLCRNPVCPSSWEWVGTDEACHPLDTGFTLRDYRVDHIDEPDHTTRYSVVTAWYGSRSSPLEAGPSLRLVTPEAHWYCIKVSVDEALITCANDQLGERFGWR